MATPKRKRHGLKALKAKVTVLGLAAVDMRTTAAQAMFAFRGALVNALGGESEVTPQRMALIESATRTRLYIEHLDNFLLGCDSLVLKKKKTVLPVLRERMQLVDSLTRTLSVLGLDRVAARVPTIPEFLALRDPQTEEIPQDSQ